MASLKDDHDIAQILEGLQTTADVRLGPHARDVDVSVEEVRGAVNLHVTFRVQLSDLEVDEILKSAKRA